MGPDELPVELLKVELSYSSRKILPAFHGIIAVAVWMAEEVLQEFYTRVRIVPSVATTGASLWWCILARFYSKPWAIDLATSVRKLGFFLRNSAASRPNARQPICCLSYTDCRNGDGSEVLH